MNPRAGVPVISRVAFLLSLQGTGQLFSAFFGALTLPMQYFYAGRQARLPDDTAAAITYVWMVLVVVAGLLSLRAARQNRRYVGRSVALWALALGPLTCALGLPVMLYGLWSYHRPAVRSVFELGERGAGEWEIIHAP